MAFANNKDADQPLRPRSVTSVFVFHSLDNTISIDVISNIATL